MPQPGGLRWPTMVLIETDYRTPLIFSFLFSTSTPLRRHPPDSFPAEVLRPRDFVVVGSNVKKKEKGNERKEERNKRARREAERGRRRKRKAESSAKPSPGILAVTPFVFRLGFIVPKNTSRCDRTGHPILVIARARASLRFFEYEWGLVALYRHPAGLYTDRRYFSRWEHRGLELLVCPHGIRNASIIPRTARGSEDIANVSEEKH